MLPTNIKTFATVYIKLEGGEGQREPKLTIKKERSWGKGAKRTNTGYMV